MTGIGGQGIQLIAKLLAEAAMREGRQVMMFGMFMGMIRGGSSESTIVIGDAEIITPPLVPSVWGVVAMHGDGLAKLKERIEPDGVLLTNANLIAPPPSWEGVRHIAVPATETAKAMGQLLGASMVALGAFAAATGIVTIDSLQAALTTVLPPHRAKHVEGNRALIERGAALVTPGG